MSITHLPGASQNQCVAHVLTTDAQMNSSDKVSIKLDTHGTPAENLQRLITDCGVSPHKVGTISSYNTHARLRNWSRNFHPNPLPTR